VRRRVRRNRLYGEHRFYPSPIDSVSRRGRRASPYDSHRVCRHASMRAALGSFSAFSFLCFTKSLGSSILGGDIQRGALIAYLRRRRCSINCRGPP
jgi:hypothetical protein